MQRPEWASASWWRQPVTPIYISALALSFGRGAWLTCWAMFFIRSVGLTSAQFGIGITTAGVAGLILGAPIGYFADRLGVREMLIALGVLEGVAVLCYIFFHNFWAVIVITCLMITAERAGPGIRIAVISGLLHGDERMSGISTARVASQAGIVIGAVFGGFILSLDSKGGYLAFILFYGLSNLACALLIVRVPHVEALRDRQVVRRVLVLHDRPFLLVTFLNGLLTLSWGMLDSGVPLWITHHAHAPLWIMSVLTSGNAAGIVLFQRRASRSSGTIAGAGRLGLWSGLLLALSCLVFATSYHTSGTITILILLIAATVHVVGELYFVASGWGLSIALTREEAHGEYQGVFATGQAAMMVLAPGIMTVLLVEWGLMGWFVLAATYLVGGVGTIMVSRWVLRRPGTAVEPAAETPQAALKTS